MRVKGATCDLDFCYTDMQLDTLCCHAAGDNGLQDFGSHRVAPVDRAGPRLWAVEGLPSADKAAANL